MDKQKIRCSILLLIWGLVTSSLSDQFDLVPGVEQAHILTKSEKRVLYQKSYSNEATHTWMLSLSMAYIDPCWVLANSTNTLTNPH